MARNLYREWFVKFRFPGYEDVKFVDSELGKIPEGWEGVTIEKLYDAGSGGTPSRKVSEYYGGNNNWIKTKELKDGFIFKSEEKITDIGIQKSSAKLYPKNTVVIAMYGATIGKLGILSREMATNQACCAFIPKFEIYSYPYLYITFLNRRKEIIGLGQGAAQQNISQILLKNMFILKPLRDVMEKFNEIVHPIFENLKNLQKKNQNLRETRDLLLPKLISGEIDVSDLEIVLNE